MLLSHNLLHDWNVDAYHADNLFLLKISVIIFRSIKHIFYSIILEPKISAYIPRTKLYFPSATFEINVEVK